MNYYIFCDRLIGKHSKTQQKMKYTYRVKISAPFSGVTVNLLDEGTSSKLAVIWPGSVTVGQTP